jgi:uncharacterized membrane protein YbaN (DUF454 family)
MGAQYRERGSPVVRAFFFTGGAIAFTLGIAGVFLPLLPAAPLLILAAACFARAYRPFHQWMLGQRWLGPMLKEWDEHRSLPYRTKIVAIVTMPVSIGLSAALVVPQRWLQALLAATALAVAVWLYRITSRNRPSAPR